MNNNNNISFKKTKPNNKDNEPNDGVQYILGYRVLKPTGPYEPGDVVAERTFDGILDALIWFNNADATEQSQTFIKRFGPCIPSVDVENLKVKIVISKP